MLPPIFGKTIPNSDVSAREARKRSRALINEKAIIANLQFEAGEVLRLATEKAAKIFDDDSKVQAHNENYAYAVARVRKGETATSVARQTNFNRKTILTDSKKPLLSSVVHEPEDTSLEDAVVRVCGGEKASSVQRSTGIPRTTILSAYYRFNGSHLNTSVGRPVSVEPDLLQDLKASAKKRTMDGNCWERVHDYSSSASILIPGTSCRLSEQLCA